MQKAVNACASLRNWQSLRHRADFLRLQKNGQKWITPAFVIQLSFRNDSSLPPEIGFTATKKLGNAVIRNRCRRRLRAMCDNVVSQFTMQGVQAVIIARSESETTDFEKLSKDLRWALRRLNVPENRNTTNENTHQGILPENSAQGTS